MIPVFSIYKINEKLRNLAPLRSISDSLRFSSDQDVSMPNEPKKSYFKITVSAASYQDFDYGWGAELDEEPEHYHPVPELLDDEAQVFSDDSYSGRIYVSNMSFLDLYRKTIQLDDFFHSNTEWTDRVDSVSDNSFIIYEINKINGFKYFFTFTMTEMVKNEIQ